MVDAKMKKMKKATVRNLYLKKSVLAPVWELLRDVRILCLAFFRPNYIMKMTRERKGKCPADCCCCWKCDHRAGTRCDIYKTRPQACRMFPVDPIDTWFLRRIYKGFVCRLYW